VSGPVIGIAGAGYVVNRFWGELPVRGVPTSYVDAVAAAGGRPVILPPGHALDLLDMVDAVVLAGGGDVDPTLYGPPDDRAIEVDRARDEGEIALVRALRSRGIPLLAVCRGLQVLTVADGGSLITDLGPDQPHVAPEVGHAVKTSSGTLLASLIGTACTVSSLHHQAVARLGSGWLPTCRAADGCIEGVEWVAPGWWPALGVQWHPELDSTGTELFGWLVRMAIKRPLHDRLAGWRTLPTVVSGATVGTV
jgi:putative glutamine amidotransferase